MPDCANRLRATCPLRPLHRVRIQVGVVGDKMDKASSVDEVRARWETCESIRRATSGCTRRLDSRRAGWAAIRGPGVQAPPGLGSEREVHFLPTW